MINKGVSAVQLTLRPFGREDFARLASWLPTEADLIEWSAIPMITQHYAMLQRNLALHPGVTRGKRLVVLVGQEKAVAIAVRNVSGRRRWSKLSEWLRSKPPVAQQFGMAR